MTSQLFIPSFLKNTYKFQIQTKVVQIDNDKILFQDTIFHPQGGGQPKDKGFIILGDQKYQITNASSQRQTGKIWNFINNTQKFKVGDKVIIKIDQQYRKKNAKLHSAGHIIDLAVNRLNYEWQTAKGYHFQDSPYVQYKGTFQGLEQKCKKLNQQLNKIISQNIPSIKQHYSYNQAIQKGLIPEQFKASLIRIVKFGQNSCPCGGTHIQNTNQIKKLQITKLSKKGKFIRAYYIVQ